MTYAHHFGIAFMAGTLLSLVNAQGNPTDPRPDRGLQGTTQAGSANRTDAILANWLIADNEKEIALARIAQQRAQNPEVKQFAEKMIKEHEQFTQKLRPAAGGMGAVGRAGDPGTGRPGAGDTGVGGTGTGGERTAGGTGRPGAGQDTTPPRTDPTDPIGGGRQGQPAGEPREASGVRPDPSGMPGQSGMAGHPHGTLDHVALVKELARKCTESARSELESKQGAEFDHCYMGMAVMAHMGAHDKLAVFRNHASASLKTTLAECQSTVKQHLDHAKQLAKKVEAAKTEEGR
jgi:predicted outer membrane protein